MYGTFCFLAKKNVDGTDKMEAMYTCKGVKYDPGEGGDISITFIIEFDVGEKILHNYVMQHFSAGLLLPMKPDHIIDEFLGEEGRCWSCSAPFLSRIVTFDKYKFELDLPTGKIKGSIPEKDLMTRGVKSAMDYLKGDTSIKLIITNSISKQVDQYDAYYFSVKLGN